MFQTTKMQIFGPHFEENLKALLSVLLYGNCSVAIVVVNKLLMTTYSFDYPVFIMASQMLFTIILLESLNLFGLVSLPTYNLERAKSFAFPSLFYGINSVLALSALNNMNIALYGVLKRCVPVVTLILSVIILKKGWPSRMTILSVLLLTSGCIIAGFGDLKFNVYGYACGAISNVTHAVYLLLVHRSVNGKLSTVESLQLNSYNTLPFLAITCLVNGEMSQLQIFSGYKNITFIVIFILTISLGCLLNYSLFLCTHLTSALTTSVVGGVKAIAQTAIGFFTFGGVSHNLATYFGVSISVGGGIGYIFAKYFDQQERDRQDEAEKIAVKVDSASENGRIPNGNIH